MKEYEVVCTYLNGCAGAAHPTRSFEEVELADPADYIKAKHPADFDKFTQENRDSGVTIFTYSGTVTYIYEFTEL